MDSLLAASLLPGTCTVFDAGFTEQSTLTVAAGTPFIFYVQCQLSSWGAEDTRVVVKSLFHSDLPSYPFQTLTAKLKYKNASVLTFTATFKDPGVYPLVLYVGNSLNVQTVFVAT